MTKTLCCDAVAEEIGVTGVAEMASYTLKEETAFLVLATDGVWEFLTSQSVVDLVSREGIVSFCCTLQQLAGSSSGCLWVSNSHGKRSLACLVRVGGLRQCQPLAVMTHVATSRTPAIS